MDSSSSSSTSKRARPPTGGSQVVSCLVDGCKSDLSRCRDYHRRHKVCELHSKTPRVTIGGREQRFCQQCSRFHSLGEFDEGKRSCRKRLEGHNRRRRKPQPDTVPGNFLSSGRGGGGGGGGGGESRFLAFSSSSSSSPMNIIPASSMVNCSWGGAVKAESSPGLYNSSHSQLDVLGGASSYPTFRGIRQFPFLQGSSSSTTTASGGGHHHHHHHHQGIDSALSLLSSSPADTREIGLSHMVQQPAPPSFIPGLHYNSIGQISQLHGSDNDMMPPNSSALHHCQQDVFQDGSCSATGPQQTVSFLWE